MTVEEVLFQMRRVYIILSRESGHGFIIPGTMYRGGRLGKLLPVGRSHEQYFTSAHADTQELKINAAPA